jgi:hypothetical protein
MFDSVIYWQEQRSHAAFCMMLCMMDDDNELAIFWQEQAAYAHRCAMSNLEFATR